MSDTPYPSPEFPGRGIDGELTFPQTTHGNYEIIPIAKGDSPHVSNFDILGEGWATEDNGLNAYIYGIVRYRDAFESLRETYFGYLVRGRNLERVPSDAYNKNTNSPKKQIRGHYLISLPFDCLSNRGER
jgi:hypothetical protein